MKKLLFSLLMFLWASPVLAVEPVFIVGYGSSGSVALDFRLTQSFGPVVTGESYEISPFGNIGATWWLDTHRHRPGQNDQIVGLVAALGFELAYPAFPGVENQPYVALSAGPSLISDNEFMGRKLGGSFIFNTRAAFGLRFGRKLEHDLAFNAMHYSNGYTYRDNESFNSLGLSYGFAF